MGAYGPCCEVGAQCKHPPSSHSAPFVADYLWSSAVFVGGLTWFSHTAKLADSISQTETAVDGV
jgi:hypothetical protein